MGEVGDGSMGSPPNIEPLPMTENADCSVLVDLSNLENRDATISALVAKYCRRKRRSLFARTMQRNCSSSNPFNLHWSQTPYPQLAVPPPCEIANEQRSEFQRPSWAFPSDPAGMGDDNEAAGLQGFCASYKSDGLSSKRIRGPDFTDEEKAWVLPARFRDPWEITEKMRFFYSPSTAICENLLAPGMNKKVFRRDPSNLVNPDTVSVFVSHRGLQKNDYRWKNKTLQVKVPWEYINSMGPLIQMGFDKIAKVAPTYIVLREDKSRVEEEDSQKKSNLTSANELHEGASDVTLMPRGTIASSSNPYNPICNQTLGGAPWGAVPPPWETACEQGPGFQHSSQPGFPSGPAGMGNAGNEASGLQGFAAGPEIPECGVQIKKRPRSANESYGLPSRRPRGSVFKDEEKGSLLQFMLEFLQDPANEGKPHAWLLPVTEKMKHKGYVRDPESWRGLWETLIKNLDAMRRWFPEGITGYWDLTEDDKSAIKHIDKPFPLTFKREWVVAMENIWKIKPRMKPTGAPKKRTRRDGQEVSTVTSSAANFAGAGSSDDNNQISGGHPTQAGAQGSHKDLQLANQQTPGALQSAIEDFSFLQSLRKEDNQDIAMENIWKMKPGRASQEQTRWDGQEGAFTQSLVSTMTGSAANFAVADCLEETGDESDSESETIGVPTAEEVSSGDSGGSVESHTEVASADSHGPRIEPSRKRSAASAFDGDRLFAKIRPFVNQQIEEAVLPLINALRSREEDEHKHRQKMLALEREKLALMRQKLECARRSNAVPASVAK